MNAMDNSTLDFGTVDLGSESSTSQVSAKVKKIENSTIKSTPFSDKTNGQREEPSTTDAVMKRPVGRLPPASRSKAPGLGEPAVQGDETGECKQS